MPREKPKGSWKSTAFKKRQFAARALKWTKSTQKEIAEWAGLTPHTVANINFGTVEGTPIRGRGIDRKRIFENLAKLAEERKKPKVNHFSEGEKRQFIQESQRAIFAIARKWFFGGSKYSWLLRQHFVALEDFVATINGSCFLALDYFDPTHVSKKTGKRGVKPLTYIWRVADNACNKLAKSLMPKNYKGSEYGGGLWFDFHYRKLLKKIGPIPELYEGAENPLVVIERLREIVKKNDVGLTQRMRRVVLLRLGGKTSGEIAQLEDFKTSSRNIANLEREAIEKIRAFFSPKK